MRIVDWLFTRRRDRPRFAALPRKVRRRLAFACRELGEAEREMADRLGLARPPRLLMIDEEEAVILSPADRRTHLRGVPTSAEKG